MGFEPLPFDPVGPCLCHRNCSNFQKVSARYWVTVFGFEVVPRLAAGVLMQLDPGSTSQNQCIWTAVIPFTFPESFLLIQIHEAPASPFRINYRVEYDVFLTPLSYLSVRTDPDKSCGFNDLDLVKVSGPEDWLGSELIRVDWWKNANDVPH